MSKSKEEIQEIIHEIAGDLFEMEQKFRPNIGLLPMSNDEKDLYIFRAQAFLLASARLQTKLFKP